MASTVMHVYMYTCIHVCYHCPAFFIWFVRAASTVLSMLPGPSDSQLLMATGLWRPSEGHLLTVMVDDAKSPRVPDPKHTQVQYVSATGLCRKSGTPGRVSGGHVRTAQRRDMTAKLLAGLAGPTPTIDEALDALLPFPPNVSHREPHPYVTVHMPAQHLPVALSVLISWVLRGLTCWTAHLPASPTAELPPRPLTGTGEPTVLLVALPPAKEEILRYATAHAHTHMMAFMLQDAEAELLQATHTHTQYYAHKVRPGITLVLDWRIRHTLQLEHTG